MFKFLKKKKICQALSLVKKLDDGENCRAIQMDTLADSMHNVTEFSIIKTPEKEEVKIYLCRDSLFQFYELKKGQKLIFEIG
ncbi:MAG: hypothetical protein GY861_12040 [bacterium]|nr:hypothetical protein [bacterium]